MSCFALILIIVTQMYYHNEIQKKEQYEFMLAIGCMLIGIIFLSC